MNKNALSQYERVLKHQKRQQVLRLARPYIQQSQSAALAWDKPATGCEKQNLSVLQRATCLPRHQLSAFFPLAIGPNRIRNSQHETRFRVPKKLYMDAISKTCSTKVLAVRMHKDHTYSKSRSAASRLPLGMPSRRLWRALP